MRPAFFFNEDGQPKKTGDWLVQKDLAKTLREIAKNGRNGFYNSWVTEKIIAKVKSRNGLLTQKDFNAYNVRYREPVQDDFNGYQVASMPTPSSGGVHILEILNILDPFELKKMGVNSSKAVHLTSAAMQQAFSDRAKYMGDSDFVAVPTQDLVSDAYADEVRKTIALDRAKKSEEVSVFIETPYESNETTHFSIMDGEGNVISTTQTINYWLGSGVVVDGTGIVLNNEMDDFTAKPGQPNGFGAIGGVPNAIEPEKRPLSSMSPTIVFDTQGQPVMTVGAPGGTKIISCVLHTLLNYFEYDMPLYEAVNQMRYHHQWYPDEIRVEAPSFEGNTLTELENLGYTVNEKSLGCKVQAVTKEKNMLHAVSDTRGEGRSYAQ
jgi:gamma-glutamyltranspeptidase/glutathione hydrolase